MRRYRVAMDSRVYRELEEQYPDAKKILAEGDSWFAYPRQFFLIGKASNIIDQLAKKKDLIIYSSASNGDEVTNMLSGDQKFGLLKRLGHNKFDILLFSGGGNDIVGRYDFGFLLNEREAGMTWQDCINTARLELKLSQIRLAYQELIERTKDVSLNPNIQIVTHTYDYAIPSKEGFELFDLISLKDSWMYPYLKRKKITDREDQKTIVKFVLQELRTILLDLQTSYQDCFRVIDTQGMLTEDEWRNEIHPTPDGFEKIAQKIYEEGILAAFHEE